MLYFEANGGFLVRNVMVYHFACCLNRDRSPQPPKHVDILVVYSLLYVGAIVYNRRWAYFEKLNLCNVSNSRVLGRCARLASVFIAQPHGRIPL